MKKVNLDNTIKNNLEILSDAHVPNVLVQLSWLLMMWGF